MLVPEEQQDLRKSDHSRLSCGLTPFSSGTGAGSWADAFSNLDLSLQENGCRYLL